MLLRDFFHSLAINSALFFESLFAIDAAGRILNWMLRMSVEGGSNGKGKWLVSESRVNSMDVVSSFL